MKPYILAAGAAVTVLLASCGSSDTKTNEPASVPAAPSTAAASTAAGGSDAAGGIVIEGFNYSGTLTVKPSAEVTVNNKDTVAHTATAKDKSFDSGNIDAGASGKFTAPSKAGSYPIICKYHPRMAATLIVKG
jgi:plastocyanin